MTILTMPVLVLFVLRIVASIADARVAERGKRVLAAMDAAEKQADASATSVSSLTEQPPRDQG